MRLLRKTAVLIALLLIAVINEPALAHAPIFMMAPEAPGKGAFDLHTNIEHGKQGSERSTRVEQEFTFGLSRDFSVGFAVPFARQEYTQEGTEQTSVTGIDNPKFFGQWRFWDKDVLGAKYSSALRLSATAPVGDKNIARDKSSFLAGLAYGMESLKWYYTFDARYLNNLEDNGAKPGDRFFADAAVGLRPHLAKLEETDIVLYMEFNYMKELKTMFNGGDNPDSGGDYFFISPEILISPSNRLMLRGGFQIPVYQDLNGAQAPKDFTFKITMEARF